MGFFFFFKKNNVNYIFNSYFGIFIMNKDGAARFDIVQNLELKFIEIFSLNFFISNEDKIRQIICFRYNFFRSKLFILQKRLLNVYEILEEKNPSLLVYIKKTTNLTKI